MLKNYEDKYHIIEKSNWWFKARRDLIINLIKGNSNNKILDVGCSGGLLLLKLKSIDYNNIYGLDISNDAINICKNSGLKNVFVRDGLVTKFKDEEFDFVIASDILEHIRQDSLAIKEWTRILKKSGRLIIFVPAFQSLWSDHDELNYHVRRYNKNLLLNLAKNNNLAIERLSFWNFSLFIPSIINKLAKRFIKSRNKMDDFYKVNNTFNNILYNILRLENKLIHTGINMPIGVSLFVILRK